MPFVLIYLFTLLIRPVFELEYKRAREVLTQQIFVKIVKKLVKSLVDEPLGQS